MNVKYKFLVPFLGLFIALTAVAAAAEQESQDPMWLIRLILQQSVDKGKYTIVTSRTDFWLPALKTEEQIAKRKRHIRKNIIVPGYDLTPLLDELFEVNKQSIPLTIKSEPSKGFLIDYDGKFDVYFEQGSQGRS